MHYIIITLLISIMTLFFSIETRHTLLASANKIATHNTKIEKTDIRKKIVIFTCNGGYGHQAASTALNSLLSEQYDIHIINLFKEIELGGYINGEEFYNRSLRGGWIRSINFIYNTIVPPYVRLLEKSYRKKIDKLLVREKPDLVISVIPLINGPLAQASSSLKIPFLLVTTDGDLTNWVVGLKKLVDKNFKVTIGFESSKTQSLLNDTGINNKNISLTGFPIRKDFLEKKDKKEIRKTWQIPDDKFTIMILMGGAGSQATYRYVKKINTMKLPVHLLVCTGNNQEMRTKLEKLQKKASTSMTIVPFTQKIADLMSASDLLITKAGPGSINESIYTNLPMLIDNISPLLWWEKENISFVERNHFGQAITSFKALEVTIKKHLNNQVFHTQLNDNLHAYPKQNFDANIMQLVQSLCPYVHEHHQSHHEHQNNLH